MLMPPLLQVAFLALTPFSELWGTTFSAIPLRERSSEVEYTARQIGEPESAGLRVVDSRDSSIEQERGEQKTGELNCHLLGLPADPLSKRHPGVLTTGRLNNHLYIDRRSPKQVVDGSSYSSVTPPKVYPLETTLKVLLPDSYKLNPLGPSKLELQVPGTELQIFPIKKTTDVLTILGPRKKQFKVNIKFQIFYCEKQEGGMCFVKADSLQASVLAENPELEIAIKPA